MTDLLTDPLLGRAVEIFSVNGMRYEGVVMAIRDRGELGELFELGSHDDPSYHRLVYVTDRLVQIRDLSTIKVQRQAP
jgi:hypothetical protein